MKKVSIAISLLLIVMWQPAIKMAAQLKQAPVRSVYDAKENEKMQLFERVNMTQDSIIKILNNRPRRSAPVKYIKIYKSVDTLKVKNNIIVTPVAELPDDYYLIPDTTPEKKKKRGIVWKLFHHKQ